MAILIDDKRIIRLLCLHGAICFIIGSEKKCSYRYLFEIKPSELETHLKSSHMSIHECFFRMPLGRVFLGSVKLTVYCKHLVYIL